MTQPHSDDNQTSWTAPHSDDAEHSSATAPHSDNTESPFQTAPPSDGGAYKGGADAPLPPGGLPLLDGKYVAQERYAGGMGVVYKCVKRSTGQVVALKTVLSEGPMSEDEIKTMRRNYDRVHSLSHDHIVRVNALEVDERKSQWYVEMDWVEGENLKEHLRKFGGDKRQEAIRILWQVAEALDYAHFHGVIHRDVKDANIMIKKETGDVVLIDFGIASRAPHPVGQNETVTHDVTATTTTASVFAGTSGYQSPEQWLGEYAEASSDEYSLAVTAYRCLSEHLPFWSDNTGMLQEMVLHHDVPLLMALPEEANAVLKKGLAKKPSERYATCKAFMDALKKGLSSPAGGSMKDGVKVAGTEKDASFSMTEFYILSGDMEERLAESGKRKWDRDQTFGNHLDTFSKAMRGAKSATVNKDYAIAYSLFKQAEDEWKWLEANEPLRTAAAASREKAMVSQKTAVEAEAGRLAAEKQQEAAELLKTADGDFESGRFKEAEKKYAAAANAFAKAAEMARIAKRIMDLEKSIEKAIKANCFQDARIDVAKLKELDAAKAASWEATLENTETVWKREGVGILEETIRKAIEEKRFKDARHDVDELRKLNALKAVSWEKAIVVAAKAKQVEDLENSISEAIATKDFENARRVVAGMKKLDAAKALSWESAIRSAYRAELVDELEKSIRKAIEKKRFQDARKIFRDLRILDATNVASWEAEIESADKAERIKSFEKTISVHLAEKHFEEAHYNINELKKVDVAKAESWEVQLNEAEALATRAKWQKLIGGVIGILVLGIVLFLPFKPKPNKTTVRKEGENYVVTFKPGVELKLLKVDAGSFIMGSNDGDEDEKSVHKVTLTKDFWLGETEVTQAQYEAVMGVNPSYFRKGGKCPVEQVSWNDAMEFCKKLTEQERKAGRLLSGYEYTLPTEAQWEYAARGGNMPKGYQYSGSDNLDEVGRYGDSSCHSTHPVGGKKPNELGLYDMSGNVWEWCRDWSGDYPNVAVTDSAGLSDGSYRVYRGGGWNSSAADCRSANRSYCSPGNCGNDLGFRLALVDLDSSTSASSQPTAPMESETNATASLSTTETTDKEIEYNKNIQLPGDVELKLVKVEAGNFMMGSDEGGSNEKPVHKVTLTKDYWLGETEVTQAQYEAVMGWNPSEFKKGGNFPVENVSWDDAMEFCRKLTERERKTGRLPSGYEYTLPTEAQWEYAARGGNKSRGYKYSGSDKLDEVGWYYENSGRKRLDEKKRDDSIFKSAGCITHLVKEKNPNELGLYDMSGNVCEWCRDSSEWKNGVVTDTYRDGVVDPLCRSGSWRVNRGGFWCGDARDCRAMDRRSCSPDCCAGGVLGFRVALAPVQ